MKTIFKIALMCFMLIFFGENLLAQVGVNSPTNESTYKKLYLGVGAGFDYGGFGGKVEYLPIKQIGLFAGVGYNMLSVGYNVGASYKISPDKKIVPTISAFYGYNAVLKGDDDYAKRYEMTSYGVTFGAGIDYKYNAKGGKISVNLFLPIRSSKFTDNYDAAKNDSNLKIENDLFPIGFSIGINFPLR